MAEMTTAAESMQRAMMTLAEHRAAHGPPLDPQNDINSTGLIGAVFSPMTTTLGNLEAKRTTTNPNMAALSVELLRTAGVKRGDYITVGASGSFPALILAILCAADAMELHVGLIVSLGASQWGANLLDFTWLDIEAVLADAGALRQEYRAMAASVGGSDDAGGDLSASAREILRQKILTRGLRLVEEPNLVKNVAERVAVYRQASGRPIAAFVSIGGGWATLGTSAVALALAPGVSQTVDLPPPETRGVLHALAAEGVPVIHFLNIAALADEYGIPWDPSPLPPPDGRIVEGRESRPALGYASLPVIYLAALGLWAAACWLRGRTRPRPPSSGSVR
jgi:poly-gamma-glutamate system protein